MILLEISQKGNEILWGTVGIVELSASREGLWEVLVAVIVGRSGRNFSEKRWRHEDIHSSSRRKRSGSRWIRRGVGHFWRGGDGSDGNGDTLGVCVDRSRLRDVDWLLRSCRSGSLDLWNGRDGRLVHRGDGAAQRWSHVRRH